MNNKNIAKALDYKLRKWVETIEDEKVRKVIKRDAIITGGALVSLLNGEKPNDYDIYFKTKKGCKRVAEYYAKIFNDNHSGTKVDIIDENDRIQCFIKSAGVAEDNEIDDKSEPIEFETEQVVEDENKQDKPKYRPRFFSTNAISLTDDIQIIIRFTGTVEEIHTNYDFVHCTCSYDWAENKVNLPSRALEAIINKELFYTGSKYPLCSIIRTRKFVSRGWTINAGQYLKMCLQLNELNLKDLNVFKDQLVGVDSLYFSRCIENLEKMKEEKPDFEITNDYLFEIINRIF